MRKGTCLKTLRLDAATDADRALPSQATYAGRRECAETAGGGCKRSAACEHCLELCWSRQRYDAATATLCFEEDPAQES